MAEFRGYWGLVRSGCFPGDQSAVDGCFYPSVKDLQNQSAQLDHTEQNGRYDHIKASVCVSFGKTED